MLHMLAEAFLPCALPSYNYSPRSEQRGRKSCSRPRHTSLRRPAWREATQFRLPCSVLISPAGGRAGNKTRAGEHRGWAGRPVGRRALRGVHLQEPSASQCQLPATAVPAAQASSSHCLTPQIPQPAAGAAHRCGPARAWAAPAATWAWCGWRSGGGRWQRESRRRGWSGP